MRPGGEDPSDGDGGEDDVVEDAARLPEAGGVGEGGAEGAVGRVRKIGRGRSLRGWHVAAPFRLSSCQDTRALPIVKYFSLQS